MRTETIFYVQGREACSPSNDNSLCRIDWITALTWLSTFLACTGIWLKALGLV